MSSTIFFGNGLNRLSTNSKKWEDLLKDVTTKKIIENIPNTLQYEDLYLCDKICCSDDPIELMNYSNEYKVKCKIAKIVTSFETNEMINKLQFCNVNSFITTNYDYTFEKQLIDNGFSENIGLFDTSEQIYSIRRCHSFKNTGQNRIINIFPIHGEAKFPKSIMLGYDHYCGSISKIDSYIKGRYNYKQKENIQRILPIIERVKQGDYTIHSWIDLFFFNDIHIVGFGMDFSEQDVWWLLNKRKRFLYENKLFLKNRIYYYGVIDDSKKTLLEDFDVNVISYLNKEDDWVQLYKKIFVDLQHNL